MLCSTCGRDSTNRRVCPYCFTPYPTDDDATAHRRSGSVPTVGAPAPRRSSGSLQVLTETLEHAARDSKAFVMKQTPVVRWAGLGIALVLLFWAFSGDDPAGTVAQTSGTVVDGAALPEITREQALAVIQQTRNTALVEVHSDEVFVSYPAATFPLREDGQILLVRQFAQADSVVEGKRRRIFFHNPNGRMFAQSDGVTGVTIKP